MLGVLGKLAVVGIVAAVALAFAAPSLVKHSWSLFGGAVDTDVGLIEHVGPDVLKTRLQGKTALVVGATRGIGRGVAVTLAKAGANVHVVGRSEKAGAAVVSSMAAVAPSKSQAFKAHPHDLFTVRGCSHLVRELQEQAKDGVCFDHLVFTVGIWPDYNDPNTPDGVNKVFALDVLARFTIFEGVRPLLCKGARVMSVLASTTRMVLPEVEHIKAVVTGESPPGMGGFGMMPVVSVSADAFLQQAGARYPDIKFVGTQPGIVATDVMRTTFPSWLADMLAVVMSQIAQTEEECGDVQVNILTSPNLEKRQVSYVDPLLQARETNSLAYDQGFGKWLWSHLESAVVKYK